MPWFLIEPSGYRYPISEDDEEGLSIGRAADNDVVLTDPGVSRYHAYIRVRGQEAWLYDRGSANGVWLRGQRIQGPVLLHPGDAIQVGDVVLRMVYLPPEEPIAPSPIPTGFEGATVSYAPYVVLGIVLGLLGLVAVYLVLPQLHAPAQPTATPSPYERYAQAIPATVFLLTPVGETGSSRAGTGIILTEKGRILTAYRVVMNPTTGRAYNRKNQVMVGVLRRQDLRSLDWYRAHVVRADRQRELAVVQVFARQDGALLPNSFTLPTVPLGQVGGLEPGARLGVISFPAEGEAMKPDSDQALALGEGHLLTILPDPSIQTQRGWLVSDIALSQSNIGAPALDEHGRLVGVYPGPEAASRSGHDNAIRPIDLARPLWVTGP